MEKGKFKLTNKNKCKLTETKVKKEAWAVDINML